MNTGELEIGATAQGMIFLLFLFASLLLCSSVLLIYFSSSMKRFLVSLNWVQYIGGRGEGILRGANTLSLQ